MVYLHICIFAYLDGEDEEIERGLGLCCNLIVD